VPKKKLKDPNFNYLPLTGVGGVGNSIDGIQTTQSNYLLPLKGFKTSSTISKRKSKKSVVGKGARKRQDQNHEQLQQRSEN
jgi:hypothetical protein